MAREPEYLYLARGTRRPQRMLGVVLLFTLLSQTALAQPSPDCTSGPCVKVGLAAHGFGTWNYAFLSSYLVYCDEGASVGVEVLARFTPGSFLCFGCGHGAREWTWSISGADSWTKTSEEIVSESERVAEFVISGVGEITVECTVGALPKLGCVLGSHSGDHGGASSSCTFTLWRMALAADATPMSGIGPPWYMSTFAEEIQVTAVVEGAQVIEPQGHIHSYAWMSRFIGDEEEIAAHYDSDSWGGRIVGWSAVHCVATVRNPYVGTGAIGRTSSYEKAVYLDPQHRRPDWNVEATFGQRDAEWMQDDPSWFPVLAGNEVAYGQNTNQGSRYREYNQYIVTPVYHMNNPFPHDYAAYDDVVDRITDGPNAGMWYHCDPTLFKVARMARYNHWISPTANAPDVPAKGPTGHPYTNWDSIQSVLLGDICACANPDAHGGVGNSIRYRANIWHEEYGCPFSQYQVRLGHQAQIEDGIDNGAPLSYDPVYLCDLGYAPTKQELRAQAGNAWSTAQGNLYSRAISVHSFLDAQWNKHNFKGTMYIHENGIWSLVNGAFGGCY